jgi:hypothetical protein
VRDQRDLAGVEVFVDGSYNGCHVTDLACRRVWIALWLVRAAPAEKVEAHHGPTPGEVGE